MQDELLPLINEILVAAELLLETDLNDSQGRFVQSTYEAAQEMVSMVVSFPDIAMDRSRELFSYEARSLLASIIGYAELLLDEDDGSLTGEQRRYVDQIGVVGKKLVRILPQILG